MSGGSHRTRARALNKGFARILIFSLVLHAGVLGGVVYAQLTKRPTKHDFNSIPVELVKLGKARPPELLPRISKPAVAPPPPDEGVALDTANKEKPTPVKKDEPKAKDPEMSAAARRLLEQQPDALDKALDKIEEDEGDPNGSIYGTTTDPTKGLTGYRAQVAEILKRSYKLPATIAESERRFLTADVVLYIDRDGSIAKYEFAQTHPNQAFVHALELLLQQVKLPPPPPDLASEFKENGIAVRFKPL